MLTRWEEEESGKQIAPNNIVRFLICAYIPESRRRHQSCSCRGGRRCGRPRWEVGKRHRPTLGGTHPAKRIKKFNLLLKRFWMIFFVFPHWGAGRGGHSSCKQDKSNSTVLISMGGALRGPLNYDNHATIPVLYSSQIILFSRGHTSFFQNRLAS